MGMEVKMQPRPVTISVFEITRIELPEVDFRVVCSTGTYIRSLANDFGETVGCGGYLSALCRTRIGHFNLSDAKNPRQIAEAYQSTLDLRDSG
jgi:tRNA pseudouridine55 synthase